MTKGASDIGTAKRGQGTLIIRADAVQGGRWARTAAVLAIATACFALMTALTATASADVDIVALDVTPATRAILPGTNASFYVGITLDHSGGSANVTASLNADVGVYQVWFDGDAKEIAWSGIDNDRTINVTVKVGVSPGANSESLPFQVDLEVESANASDPGDVWDLQALAWEASVRQVYDLSVECDPTEVRIDRGEQVVFDILVYNDGNGPDTVNLDCQINGSELDSTLKEEDIIVNETTIGRGGNAYLVLTIDSFETTEPRLYLATFYARSEDHITVAALQLSIHVDAAYDIRLWSPMRTKNGAFGDDVMFTLNVQNRGDGIDVAHLLVSDGVLEDNTSMALWSTSGAKALDVPLNTSSTTHSVEVTVSVPDRETFASIFGNDTVESTYVTVRAVSGGNASYATYINLTVDLLPVRGMEALGIATVATVDPYLERNASFAIRVRNTGTRPDTYSIDLTSKPQWLEVVYDYTGSPVPAGSTVDILITAVLPADDDLVIPGNWTIGVKITPDSDSRLAQDFSLSLDVLRFDLSFALAGITTEASFDPDLEDEVNFSIRLVNDGHRDDSFDIDIGGNPHPTWLAISHDYDGSDIRRGEGVLVTVTLTRTGPPWTIRAGSHQMAFRATSRDDPSMNSSIGLDLEILTFSSISATANTSELSLKPDAPAAFQVQVSNLGNGNDSFDVGILDVLPQWGWVHLELDGLGGPNTTSIHDVTLPWGSSQMVQAVVHLTTAEALAAFGPSSDRMINITIRVNGGDGTYDISLAATLVPTYGLSPLSALNTSMVISGDAFDGFAYRADRTGDVTVKNVGNAPDSYDIRYSGGPEFSISIAHSSAVGVVDTLNVSLGVSLDAGRLTQVPPGVYDVDLSIVSQGNGSLAVVVTFFVTVMPISGFTASVDAAEKTVELDSSMDYFIQVRNSGNSAENVTIEMTNLTSSVFGELLHGELGSNVTGADTLTFQLDPGRNDLAVYRVRARSADLQTAAISTIRETLIVTSSVGPASWTFDLATDVTGDRPAVDLEFPGTRDLSLRPFPGENTIIVPVWVKNVGFAPDSYVVTVAPGSVTGGRMPGDLSFCGLSSGGESGDQIEMTDVDVGLGNRRLVNLTLTIPTRAYLVSPGTYAYDIEVRSLSADNQTEPEAFDATSFLLTVGEVRTFDLAVEGTTTVLYPVGFVDDDTEVDRYIHFDVTVMNTGNVADRYDLQVLTPIVNLSGTWAADTHVIGTLEGTKQIVVDVGPGETGIVYLSVRAGESEPGAYPLFIRMRTTEASGNLTVWRNLSIEVRAPVVEISPDGIWLGHNESRLREGNTTYLNIRIWNNGTAPIPWADINVTSSHGDIGVAQAGWIEPGGHADVTVRWSKIPGKSVSVSVEVSGLFGTEYAVKQFYFMPAKRADTFESTAALIVGLVVGTLLGLVLMIVIAHFAGTDLTPLFLGRRPTGLSRTPQMRPLPRQPARPAAPARKRVKVSSSMDLRPASAAGRRKGEGHMRWQDISGEDEAKPAAPIKRARPAAKRVKADGQRRDGGPPTAGGKRRTAEGMTRPVMKRRS